MVSLAQIVLLLHLAAEALQENVHLKVLQKASEADLTSEGTEHFVLGQLGFAGHESYSGEVLEVSED